VIFVSSCSVREQFFDWEGCPEIVNVRTIKNGGYGIDVKNAEMHVFFVGGAE
jgi:hypothetical protein